MNIDLIPIQVPAPLPVLCEIRTSGQAAPELAQLAADSGRRVFPRARSANFEPAPPGLTYRVGVAYLHHFPEYCRNNQDIAKSIRAWGAGYLPPDAAFLLASQFSQRNLEEALDARRPFGSPRIGRAIVWHEYLTDEDEFPFLLGLDSSGLNSGDSGSIYPYRYVMQHHVSWGASERLARPDLPEEKRILALKELRRGWSNWPTPGVDLCEYETAFLVRLDDDIRFP